MMIASGLPSRPKSVVASKPLARICRDIRGRNVSDVTFAPIQPFNFFRIDYQNR